MELIKPGTNIDFVGRARVFALVSVAAVLVALLLIVVYPQPKLGIDFAGGTVIQVGIPADAGAVDEGRIRSAVSAVPVDGFADAVVVRFGPADDRAFLLSLPISAEEVRDLPILVRTALADELDVEVELQRIESIGPRIGEELRSAGLGAIALSWVLILLYVWFRFDLRYAPGAVAALVHDVLLTAAIFVALGLEFNLQVLAALLVVIGYSLNDTIVIYDRIRENLELRGTTHLEAVVNQSVNQTLSRTLLTSFTTLAVVLAMLLLGGPVIRDFALALAIGVVIGTYSTIYVASALLIFLERRFGGAPAT